MSGLFSKFVLKKVLHETAENKHGREDPYFEQVPAQKLSTFSGKPKIRKRRKALPPGLSEKDQQTLVKVKRRAYRLDMALGSFCGFKVGWGSLIAIIPLIGDAADFLLALMVVRTASEADLPASVVLQMLFNVALDFVVGLVPFLGDLVDMAYKANTRNAIVLEDYLRGRGRRNLRRSGVTGELPHDPSLDEVETESGIISNEPVAHPQPVYGGPSRGYTGAQREYDPESHHGTRTERQGGSGSKKSKKGKSSRDKHKESSRNHSRD